jgi:hypothetical protein
VPYFFAILSLALAPGIARVFATAPPLHLAMHWRLAWGGFDVALAALLAATGLALFRRFALAEVLAAMTATLLCCDAWLDVLSSAGHGRSATMAAIGEAVFAELPLAALFAWVAARFARAVAEAQPSLQRAGFRIHDRRLVPPAGNYPARPDEEPASQPQWRQWTPRGHAEQPGLLLPWWLPAACLGLVIMLIPWIAWLFATLPQAQLAAHWELARAGPDLALAIVLAASAVALLRRWPVAEVRRALRRWPGGLRHGLDGADPVGRARPGARERRDSWPPPSPRALADRYRSYRHEAADPACPVPARVFLGTASRCR